VKCIPVLLLFLFLLHYESLDAQTADLSVNEWAKKLADPSDKKNARYDELYAVLNKLDSSKVFGFLNQLAGHSRAKGNYFLARFNCIKSEMIYDKNLDSANVFNNEQARKEVQNLLAEAMRKTYECNDDYLTAFVSGVYGRYMSVFGETEAAVMYMMNSADLYEKINLSAKYTIYVVLGEMLWKVREYEKSIKYSSKAISILDTSHIEVKNSYTMTCNNTVALSYHRMGQYDSAFVHYNEGLEIARKINNTAWQGIISGNMGQIYFAQGKYTTALPLFNLDYTISNEKGYYDNAANSLQWAARTNLALGNKSTALQQVRTTFELLQKWPAPNYLQNAYLTAAEVFKALKNNDSLLYYSGLYNKLHDSIERVIYQSSISIVKLRLNDEKNRYSIINLQREKQAQTQQRNLIIGAILFVSVMALLLINRRRLEKEVSRRTSQLEQKSLELEQSLNHLKSTQAQLIQSEKMASLGELTAGIAHEIQNPLNFVNNFSEVNKELIAVMREEITKGNYDAVNILAKDVEDNEEKINHHGKRADSIVKGMLQHSRSSSGKKEPTDINALADEYLRLSYHGMRAKDKSFNATMKTDFDESIGNVNIIPPDIGRVMLNLINNAFYSVDEKKKQNPNEYEPTVSVSTKRINRKVEIKVADNGNGIPQKVLDKIYQPFFTTKPTGQGTGLGLSLSYEIIKAHGGKINVNTQEGEFTEFVVHLPVYS
jgi:two-component system NtrC family sensor kinase